MSRIVFIDLETTGFSRQYNDIIEVAAILYDQGTRKALDTFHEYIKPVKSIPYKITEITGIDDYKVRDARSEVEVLRDFFEWLHLHGPSAIVGHNYKSFDHTFLKAKAEKYKIAYPAIEIIDTLQEARKATKDGKLPIPNHQQTTIATHFGIDYQAHSAIEDIKALIKIYEKLGLNSSKEQKRANLGF